MIRNLYEKYIDHKELRQFSMEEMTFERLMLAIEDRLKKSHSMI